MCCDLFILYIHFHVVCYLCVKFTSHLIEKKTVTESPCNIFVYLSVNLLLGNIRMSLLMLRNWILLIITSKCIPDVRLYWQTTLPIHNCTMMMQFLNIVESLHNSFPVVKQCNWVTNNAPWFQIKESLKSDF